MRFSPAMTIVWTAQRQQQAGVHLLQLHRKCTRHRTGRRTATTEHTIQLCCDRKYNQGGRTREVNQGGVVHGKYNQGGAQEVNLCECVCVCACVCVCSCVWHITRHLLQLNWPCAQHECTCSNSTGHAHNKHHSTQNSMGCLSLIYLLVAPLPTHIRAGHLHTSQDRAHTSNVLM
jgi:hypothetical protein